MPVLTYLPTVFKNIQEKSYFLCIVRLNQQRQIPFVSRNVAKFERRCNAILQTARIWVVNSSMIELPEAPPIPSLEDNIDEDFTTPRSRMVSLT